MIERTEYLKKQGILAQQIISINFEDMDYDELTNYKNCINI